MKIDSPRLKRIIKILYLTAGIFLVIGIYIHSFGITFTKGAIPDAGVKGKLADSINGRGLIILALLIALYAAILNYKLSKRADE